MKKFLSLVLALVMTLSLVAMASAEEGTGKYRVYNSTGEELAELYIYPNTSTEKGENLATGFYDGKTLTYTAEADTHLIIEFKTASGYVGHFDNLAIEEAPIDLLSADAMTGATMISFFAPERTGVYTLYNATGENLKELYIYVTGAEDKGENLADKFVEGGEMTYTDKGDVHLTFEFTTESGRNASFDNLAIEVAPITMLAADAMTGATPISFFAPAAE